MESLQGVFTIDPLKAHISDPEKTKLISNAHGRIRCLIWIINRMSLSRGGKGQRRGRISYSNPGVNQLGAVYEALLGYCGFFAEEDLHEVKSAGDKVDELDVGHFIPMRDLYQYTEEERVRNEDPSEMEVHLPSGGPGEGENGLLLHAGGADQVPGEICSEGASGGQRCR